MMSPPSDHVPGFLIRQVRLAKLEARPELNGAVGVLLSGIDAESGRAEVKLATPAEHRGKCLKVKLQNMVPCAVPAE